LENLVEHIEKLKMQLQKLQPLSVKAQQKLDKKFWLE
jgi:hypothetical protein